MLAIKRYREKLINATCGHRVVFHHVPKCGGMSVRRALQLRYALSYTGFGSDPAYRAFEALHPADDLTLISRRVAEYREAQLLHFLFDDIRYISGHVRFSIKAYELFTNKYKFVTTLRDPFEMILSSYRYSAGLNIERWRVTGDLEAYLETPRALAFGSMYSDFFSGLPSSVDPRSTQSIELAKANLAKLSVVGIVEEMESFEQKLCAALGVRLSIGHTNRSRGDRYETLAPKLRARIEEVSAANIEIYEFARRELAK
jgi:hypothetical protein